MDLATRGRGAAANEVLQILNDLQLPSLELRRLRKVTAAEAALHSKHPEPSRAAASRLKRAAKALDAWLVTLPQRRRPRVAAIVLKVSASFPDCQRLLGRVQVGGTWMASSEAAVAKRHARLVKAVSAARNLSVPAKLSRKQVPLLKQLYGRSEHAVKCGAVSLHSVCLPATELENILARTMRALALLHFLHTGKLELYLPHISFVELGNQSDYQRAVDLEVSSGYLSNREGKNYSRAALMWGPSGGVIGSGLTRRAIERDILYVGGLRLAEQRYGGYIQPCLEVGAENWASISVLGNPLGPIIWQNAETSAGPTVAPGGGDQPGSWHFPTAGVSGSVRYLRELVKAHQDPPYASSMAKQMGLITGRQRIKATVMVQYFFEAADFDKICQRTAPNRIGRESVPVSFERALNERLPELEKRFRAWLMPRKLPLYEQALADPQK